MTANMYKDAPLKVHQLINDLGKNHFTALCFITSHFTIIAFCFFKMQLSLWKFSYSHMFLERLASEYVTILIVWPFGDSGFAGKNLRCVLTLAEKFPMIHRILELCEAVGLFPPKLLMLQRRKLRYRGGIRATNLNQQEFFSYLCCALYWARWWGTMHVFGFS